MTIALGANYMNGAVAATESSIAKTGRNRRVPQTPLQLKEVEPNGSIAVLIAVNIVPSGPHADRFAIAASNYCAIAAKKHSVRVSSRNLRVLHTLGQWGDIAFR